jgi:carbon starvation protein CstA
MNDNEPSAEIQSPLQRVFVVASLACFISLIISYLAARTAVNLLAVPWVTMLVYAFVPMAVTFVILFRSCWHREFSAAIRTYYLLLLSCVITGGVLGASGIMFYVTLFCFNAASGGNH